MSVFLVMFVVMLKVMLMLMHVVVDTHESLAKLPDLALSGNCISMMMMINLIQMMTASSIFFLFLLPFQIMLEVSVLMMKKTTPVLLVSQMWTLIGMWMAGMV